MYRDSSGKTLDQYPQPSVAVDTAVLTVGPSSRGLEVLLVRRQGDEEAGEWALPGTFVHYRERLAAAVGRSLRDKVGLPDDVPTEQLHVFDDPDRDRRGWVMSVAHVVGLPWRVVEPVMVARPDDVCLRPVDEVRGLPFGHDDIVRRAAQWMRTAYAERPDPFGLIDEPFTMRDLFRLHEAVAGLDYSVDTFRRVMKNEVVKTSERSAGRVGKPAQLYRRRRAD
ncbi:NUDIX hydrolase [Blastococcus sp. SYSU D00820]